MTKDIHLGFEVGTGKPVAIPCRHMVISGQTQEAGKTTTLEALIARSGLTAVAFVTKRGEQSFLRSRRVKPYFRERADWQFVASVLEATMREKLKFERAWIMRASKGAFTLAQVQKNVRKQMETAKGLSQDVYLTLDGYLDIVVPRIAKVSFASTLDLKPGLNTLDLSDGDNFPHELQSLVMRSCLEWVYEKCEHTITIIPEAWEFIPQGRGSPVKLSAESLIRKGAGLRNYVWLDSQDIGGVDKMILRQCPVWLVGTQRERNEIKRTLDNIPDSIAKPKASDMATLEIGQFFACWGRHIFKVYVQPEWMSDDDARAIAKGESVTITPPVPKPQPKIEQPKEDKVTEAEANELRRDNADLRKQVETLTKRLNAATEKGTRATEATETEPRQEQEEFYQSILGRLLKEPAIIELKTTKPELRVHVTRVKIDVDGNTLRGRVARLIHGGFFDTPRNGNTAFNELQRLGFGTAKPNVYKECDKLAELGFLTKEASGYQSVPDMKVNLVNA